ncbi:unnamed protein product [Rotaria sp. Silwood2]|nr:unnamed protein product [Rotaria sp. Silwood2]CAF4316602.1 unnamed protein product [Rotaria sp. Silwood2]
MSVVPIFERESAIIVGAGDAAYAHHTRETTIIGNIRATGVTVTIRNNYAARYNFAVRQYNNLPLSEEKTLMFGDLFLVHRYTVIFLWLLSMICGGIRRIKPCSMIH